ncbi:MAG: triose-phosphate isomerase [Luteitalea sp.]|nr:triose-phosphate isomerase [Luteitalea sp.]
MRMPFVAANWKMYKTVHEAVAFAKQFKSAAKDLVDMEIVLAPPFLALHAVADAVRATGIAVAGQDLYWEREGAFTGAVSGPMLREAGAELVIIGHSERRRLFGETDETVSRKVHAAFSADLTPIVCVGETLEQRDRGETLSVLDQQLTRDLDGLSGEQVGLLVVAYEPVWAIGTGRNATPEQAAEAHQHIRQRLRGWFGADAADQCHVIYGGSVKPDNTAELMRQPDVDGALVGGASLDVTGFLAIVNATRVAAARK